MSWQHTNQPIDPLAVAAKLSSIANFEHEDVREEMEAEPRIAEALWFLQWASHPQNYAGGLRKLAADLIAASRDLLDAPFTGAEAASDRVPGRIAEAWQRADFEPEWISECVEKTAREHLAAHLYRLCVAPSVLFKRPAGCDADLGDDWREGSDCAPWYFPRVGEALLRFMDRWRDEQLAAIVETEVSRLVFEGLNDALEVPECVRIEGNSRFGKTEAVRAWCRANPGRARLVETPDGCALSDLVREVCAALGISRAGRGGRAERVRETVATVLASSRLMLVFDEAHGLFPPVGSAAQAPARLSWVRRGIIDRGCVVALIVTPQNYRKAAASLVKRTGYAMEQVEGRIARCELPATISDVELLAVAGRYLPGASAEVIQYAADVASLAGNYVGAAARLGKKATYLASKAGRSRAEIADVDAAKLSVLRDDLLAPAPAAPAAPAAPPQPPCSAPAQPLSDRANAPATATPRRRQASAAELLGTAG